MYNTYSDTETIFSVASTRDDRFFSPFVDSSWKNIEAQIIYFPIFNIPCFFNSNFIEMRIILSISLIIQTVWRWRNIKLNFEEQKLSSHPWMITHIMRNRFSKQARKETDMTAANHNFPNHFRSVLTGMRFILVKIFSSCVRAMILA